MESKKINQLATELAPELSDLTIIGDPTTGISKKITLSQMASLFTGTVEEYASLSAFPLVGAADTIYIALDTNIIYRWNTSTNAYVELSPNIVTSLVFSDANGFDGTISLVGSTATLTITTALTTGSVGFIGASGALTQDNANFFWDNSNKRLGINTNTPTTALDVFGSGIIGRVNGTSTNNAFIGFASAGTNKWSIGNVQSDHRFRIYNEATTSELVSVLQTGEFGIGIANPTTKLHIDGGASALIANLDANVSVAKSISFRSDNSNRINLEVSGTESGSNAGMDFFLRTYTDAGALLNTPFFIKRSTGNVGIGTTSPVQKLNVNGNIRIDGSGLTEFIINNGTNEWEMYMPSGSNDLRFYRGTDKVTLTSGGNVGIGITNPTYPLEVFINSSATPARFLGGNESLRLDTSSTSYDASIRFYNNNSATYWGGFQAGPAAVSGGGVNIFGNGAYPMIFSVNGAERIRIKESGDIKVQTGTLFGFSDYVANSTGVGLVGSGENLLFYTGGNEKMRLTSDGRLMLNQSAGATNVKFKIRVSDQSSTNYAILVDNSVKDLILIRNDGNIGLNSSVYNNTTSGTTRTMYMGNSDYYLGGISSIRKSKKNIQEFSSEWIYSLQPVQFNYRKKDKEGNYTEEFYDEINFGLIAEDTAPIADFLINYNDKEDGTKEMVGIEYSRLITPMLKEIQELKKQIELLKAK